LFAAGFAMQRRFRAILPTTGRSMTKARKHIDAYLEGWRLGDANMSLGATTPEFFYDDPNTGRIPRKDFLQFFEDFRSTVVDGRQAASGGPFLTYTDVVISEASVPPQGMVLVAGNRHRFSGLGPCLLRRRRRDLGKDCLFLEIAVSSRRRRTV
jgi:hypothetical protein